MPYRRCAALDAIAGYADSRPESPAVIEPDGVTLSYKKLWGQVEDVVQQLREIGIGPESTVAILLPPGLQQVLAVTGVLNFCACCPLKPQSTVAEVEDALRRSSAAALILAPEYEAESRAASGLGLAMLIAGSGELAKDWEIRRPASALAAQTADAEAVLLLVTSATTGSSKLVPLTVANLDAQTLPRRDVLRLTAEDRLLQMTPLHHSMGIENVLAQFLAGGAVIATAGFDPTAYLRWLDDLRPTWYDCAPTVHQAALTQLRRAPLKRPVSLRFVQSAGAPLPNDVKQELEKILHLPVLNDYGMTETGPIASNAFLSVRMEANWAGRSCGLEIGIMSSTGELLPRAAEGEIVVRGAAAFSGYVDDREASRAVFQDGWFRTGDAGRLDEQGNLFITGRLKEMINRGGEKVSPAEVDAVLMAHPRVLDPCTFAVSHPTLGEDVACAVVLLAGNGLPVSAEELRQFVAQRLAAYKVPRRIYFVDEIPRGELGKPQRWLLAECFSSKDVAPLSPIRGGERETAFGLSDVAYRVHEIWARILDRDDLGYDEDFFEAGGDSLAALNMLAEVDERFGSHTSGSAASFLDEPTLSRLVSLVNEAPLPRPGQSGSSEIRIYPVREAGARQRLFCIPTDGHEGLYFRRLAARLQGEMDVFIVRPENTWFRRTLFTFEDNGAEMASLIRQAQPEDPYFVAGYCFGGVVAAEAVRKLCLDGRDARLILFDAYLPGRPLSEMVIVRRWPRKVAWEVATRIRRLLVPIVRFPGVLRLLHQAEKHYFPLYQASSMEFPILHFISTETSETEGAALFGWRDIARRGIEEHFVAFDHNNVLHESNLPKIVTCLRQWIEQVPSSTSGR